MKEMRRDEIQRGYSLITVLGITVLVLLLLVNTAGAAPFAYVSGITLSSNGLNTGVISVIDTATNKITTNVTIDDHLEPWGIAVSPDGSKVYIANMVQENVYVIDAATNTISAKVEVEGSADSVAVSPDGTKVYVTTNKGYDRSYNGGVSIIDTATNKVTATVRMKGIPKGVAVSPDGTKAYVASCDIARIYTDGIPDPFTSSAPWSGEVSVIDTARNEITAILEVGENPLGVAVTPDGSKVYVTNAFSDNVYVIDTATNTITDTVDVGDYPLGVAVVPDGTRVYVANSDSNGTVSVIDTATNNVIATVNVGSWPRGVAVTPDGNQVYVSGSYDGNVYVINTANNTVTATVGIACYCNAFGQFIVPAAPGSFFTKNVFGTNHQYQAWGQYPLINLFGNNYVPLLDNNDPLWKCHINKLARLVLDSTDIYTLKTGEERDIGNGYSLQVKQVDIEGKKVWLEFDKNGEYVADQIVSVDSGDETWTCTLDNIKGVNNVPVLKVHVNRVFQEGTDTMVQIDGLWAIDYTDAKTLKVGSIFGVGGKFGKLRFYILTKIINGTDESYLGGLVFEKCSAITSSTSKQIANQPAGVYISK